MCETRPPSVSTGNRDRELPADTLKSNTGIRLPGTSCALRLLLPAFDLAVRHARGWNAYLSWGLSKEGFREESREDDNRRV